MDRAQFSPGGQAEGQRAMHWRPTKPPSHRTRLVVVAIVGATVAILALGTCVLKEAIRQVPVIDEDRV
jgi:hypothetical protein